MKQPYLETGVIVGTHGVHGELRVQPWSDTPDFLCGFDRFFLDTAGRESIVVTASRVHKNVVLLTVEGVHDIPAAERLRGRMLFIDRVEVELEPGAHFIQDLLGCTVTDDRTGDPLGKLTDVFKTGANDVWQVTNEGRNYLVPVIPDVVRLVDPDQGLIRICPLEGIFDHDD